MWLNLFEIDDKSMSPIELLTLVSIQEDYISTNQIMNKLAEKTAGWIPKAGTVYPVLHRLDDAGFLDKTKKGKRIRFKRTNRGSFFLRNSLNLLSKQIKEDYMYYLSIIEALIHINPPPGNIENFIHNIIEEGKTYLSKLQKLSEESKKIKDDAYDVPISFED